MKKTINEAMKRRFAVLAGLKDETSAKREQKAEEEAKREKISRQIDKMLEGGDSTLKESKHTKKGPSHIKGGKSNLKNLSEMDKGFGEEEDDLESDAMSEPSEDFDMGDEDGMGDMGAPTGAGAGAKAGAGMGAPAPGGQDDELATRLITRIVDAIKAELNVDMTVDSDAPDVGVPGAGMDDMDMDDMGGEDDMDMDDMGGEDDMDMDDMGDDDEMMKEDAFQKTLLRNKKKHQDTVSKGLNESYKKKVTKDLANEIAKETLLALRTKLQAHRKAKQAQSSNTKKTTPVKAKKTK